MKVATGGTRCAGRPSKCCSTQVRPVVGDDEPDLHMWKSRTRSPIVKLITAIRNKLLETEQIRLKVTAALAHAPIVKMIMVTFASEPMRSIGTTLNYKT